MDVLIEWSPVQQAVRPVEPGVVQVVQQDDCPDSIQDLGNSTAVRKRQKNLSYRS